MRIKNFGEFSGSIFESRGRWEYERPVEGKTVFSKWLRGINQRLKYQIQDTRMEAPDSDKLGSSDIFKQSRSAREIVPGIFRLLTGAGAAVADFFTPSKKDQKIPKSELKKSKSKILDDWEEKEIGNKQVKETDAENFYKSGVLKGQKYFGRGYDPANPKNKNEEAFSEYLDGAMKRYYDRIYTGKK